MYFHYLKICYFTLLYFIILTSGWENETIYRTPPASTGPPELRQALDTGQCSCALSRCSVIAFIKSLKVLTSLVQHLCLTVIFTIDI